jgi:DNA-binding NtrC family response regulator
MAAVLREVAIAALSSKNVLLTGDPGTGKTRIARAIHDNGPRARGTLVIVYCTAIRRETTLIEGELFGAKRGAPGEFDRDKKGLVAYAEHGTLFLHEVGDMPRGAQGKLLHLLQTKQYIPLGSTVAMEADVRVIAGTSVDLYREAARGRFRLDLLNRLDILRIRIPSLAERREDIAEMAAAFCAEACRKAGHGLRSLSQDALRALETTDWPGNVRQLEKTMQRAVLSAVSEGAMQIELRHLFLEGTGERASDSAGALTLQDAIRRFQRQLIEDSLARTRRRRD